MACRLVLFTLVTAVLAACAASDPLSPIGQPDEGPYRLDSGDQLQVTVFGQPDLSGEFFVSDTGTVSMPLLGTIPARGRGVDELESAIVARLADGFLVNPDVSIQVLEFRPFFVLGEVRTPGQYPYQPGMTVLTAVAMGGGFTYRADQTDITITRVRDGQPVEGTAERNTLVAPGDVVFIQERFF